MNRWWHVARDEAGLTLIELLATVVILGTAFAAILGGMATSIQVSALHRKQATAEAQVRTYAEDVKVWALANWGTGCQPLSAYQPGNVGFSPPSGYTAAATAIAYWQPSGSSGSFVAPPCPSDTGLQEVTLQVASAGGQVQENLQVLVRKP